MATAGYLISRAAERPAVLSLTVAIVCVRFFGLTRPIARYFERLVLARCGAASAGAARGWAVRAHRAARAGAARGIPPRRPAVARRWPTWTRCRTCTCAASCRRSSRCSRRSSRSRSRRVPADAAAVLAAGLLWAGIAVPACAAALALARAARAGGGSRRAHGGARRDGPGGAAELSVYGCEDERLGRPARGGCGARAQRATRAPWPAASATGCGCWSTGATVAGVLAVSLSAHAAGSPRTRAHRDARAARARLVRRRAAAHAGGARAGPDGGRGRARCSS